MYAVGSNPEAAAILGIRAAPASTSSSFAVCGLLPGVAGVLWGIEFGTINATVGDRRRRWQVVAAVVVGGVNIFGGSGTVVGAGLGALFLGFISNALILVAPVAVLAAGDLRRRHPCRRQRSTPSSLRRIQRVRCRRRRDDA